MESTVTPINTGLKYGLITGIVITIYTIVLHLTGQFMNWWMSIFSFGIIITAMVLAMKSFKSEHQGYLEYKEGLIIGTLLISLSSVINQVFNFIYTNYIDDSSIALMGEKTREMFEKFGMDEEKIEKAVADAQERMTSPVNIIWGILFSIIIGFIISLIVSAIMQKKRSELNTLDAG